MRRFHRAPDRMLYSDTSSGEHENFNDERVSDMRILTERPTLNVNSLARVWLRHFLCALALACLLPVVVSAYTIILRGGRRVEAPDNFVVTQTTLTYEAATGLNVTLPLAEINIAATERANNESPGSFLRRASAPQAHATAMQPSNVPPAARTLTNRELEPLRRARLERERAAAERRKELGLPPVPKFEPRSADEELQSLREIARRYEAEAAQAENYWRTRADALRTEAAALDAEIDYLRTRLTVAGSSFAPGSVAVVTTFNPFFASRSFPFVTSPSTFNAHTSGLRIQLGGRLTFGGTTRGQITLNQQSGTFQRRVIGVPGVLASPFVIAIPFNYATADEYALRIHLAELEAERAGLEARWQELEDEARRAGAQPGWLRQ